MKLHEYIRILQKIEEERGPDIEVFNYNLIRSGGEQSETAPLKHFYFYEEIEELTKHVINGSVRR